MSVRFKPIIALVLFLLMHLGIFADTVFINSKSESKLLLNRELFYFPDSKAQIRTVFDFLQLQGELQPLRYSKNNIFENPKGNKHWFGFQIKNQFNESMTMILELANPFIDELEFYEIIDNKIVRSDTLGNFQGHNHRTHNYHNFIIELNLSGNAIVNYAISVKSHQNSIHIPMYLWHYEYFSEKSTSNTLLNAIFYGFVFFILVFNLFLFLALKEEIYLYYGFFVLLNSLFILSIEGFSFNTWIPMGNFILQKFPVFILFLMGFGLFLITRIFFDLKTKLPITNKILRYAQVVIVIMAIFSLSTIFENILYQFAKISVIVFPAFLLIILIRLKKASYRTSLFLAIAYLIYLISNTIFYLSEIQIINQSQNYIWQIKLGYSLDIILISFAVVERFKEMKENAKTELENLVFLRTRKLKEQRDEIKKQADVLTANNLELSRLSMVAKKIDNGVTIFNNFKAVLFQNQASKLLYKNFIETEDTEKKYKDEIFNRIDECLDRRKSLVFESELHNKKNGQKQYIQTSITPIFDTNNEIKHLVAINTDISQLKKVEESIRIKNLHITQSINTAKSIQNALIPSKELIKKLLPETFIMMHPKDIVSGDFYWFHAMNKKIYIAAVDCTGHGVPGALISMAAFTELNTTIKEKKCNIPSEILNKISDSFNATLRITNEDSSVNEGFDIGLCSIDKNNKTIEYSGAHIPLYYLKYGEEKITEIKANQYPIGVYYGNRKKTFENHTIPFETNDRIYLMSDGFADQFGGPKNRKFGFGKLKENIISSRHLEIKEQANYLNAVFADWKGTNQQVDDVLLIGIQL